MNCPKCGEFCDRDSVNIGVGVTHGPYGCCACGWSEDSEYDLSGGKDPVDEKGGVIDQWGSYYPPGSSMALGYRLARRRTSQRLPLPRGLVGTRIEADVSTAVVEPTFVLDPQKVAGGLRKKVERLRQLGGFLSEVCGKFPGSERAYACMLTVESSLLLDIHEIETGFCGCRCLSPEDFEGETCSSCEGTGRSKLYTEAQSG